MSTTIRTKFLVYTIGLLLFILAGVFVATIYIDKAQFAKTLSQEASSIVATFARSLTNDLYRLDLHRLRRQIESARINSDIKAAYVVDARGRLLTAGNKVDARFNQLVSNEFVAKLLKAQPTMPVLQIDAVLRAGQAVRLADGTVLGYVVIVFSLDRPLHNFKDRTVAIGLIGLGFLAFGGLCALVFAWHITRPVLALVDMAMRVGQGDLSARVQVSGDDEIALLGRTLNTMTESVSIKVDQLEEAHANVKVAQREAERASGAKSEFLANMSHELRTPLNVIIGYSEVISMTMFGPQALGKYVEYARLVNQSGVHLLGIIDDLLDLSKVEAGKMDFDEDELDVEELLTDCATVMRQRAELGGVSLEIRAGGPLPRLRCDARRMKQVLLNLVSNAIKFTQEGGQVTLWAQIDTKRGMEIKVMDTGIGIEQMKIQQVLQPFEQVESVMSRQHHGTGLGLPIAKALVVAQGGFLTVESTLDVGTTFTIRMPKDYLERLSA